ncbi:hypothetical protein Tco_1181732 [Tanacetum coccineum]
MVVTNYTVTQHANPNGFGSIKTTVIWKPAINKTVVIDVLDVLDALPYNYITVFGFGVCLHTSDPKLVKIICSHKMSKKFKSFPERVKVVIDDFIYWLASDLINDSHMIVSFDTIIEDFTEVYLPDGLTMGDILISKLRESLVVLENSYGSNVRVWMMQNGDPKLFAPIFTINTPNVSIRDVSISLQLLLRNHYFCLIKQIVILILTPFEIKFNGNIAKVWTRLSEEARQL